MNPRLTSHCLSPPSPLPLPASPSAQGQTVEIASQLKLKARGSNFHGKVTADNPGCIEQRTVKLFFRYGTASAR